MKIKQKARQNPRVAALLALAEVLDEHKSLADSTALSGIRDSRDSALSRHLGVAGGTIVCQATEAARPRCAAPGVNRVTATLA